MPRFLVILFTFGYVIRPTAGSCSNITCRETRDCQNYGYCNYRKKVCCLGKYGKCSRLGSWAVRPQINCKLHGECGVNYCDEQLEICCTEGDSPHAYCPNKLTLLTAEKNCSLSRKCENGGYCYRGKCCPRHQVIKNTVMPRKFPCSLGMKCRGPLKFQNTFCDPEKNTVAIIGLFQVDGSENLNLGRHCRSNRDCPPDAVCVYTSTDGQCYHNPMKPPVPTTTWTDSYHLPVYALFPIFVFSFTIICFSKPQKGQRFIPIE